MLRQYIIPSSLNLLSFLKILKLKRWAFLWLINRFYLMADKKSKNSKQIRFHVVENMIEPLLPAFSYLAVFPMTARWFSLLDLFPHLLFSLLFFFSFQTFQANNFPQFRECLFIIGSLLCFSFLASGIYFSLSPRQKGNEIVFHPSPPPSADPLQPFFFLRFVSLSFTVEETGNLLLVC